jgi:hypothetical protein
MAPDSPSTVMSVSRSSWSKKAERDCLSINSAIFSNLSMTREMWFSMAVTRSSRCSSIPPPVPRLSKRAPEGSTRSIRRVPHWPHESSPNSLGDLQRWQKIFPRTFDIVFKENARGVQRDSARAFSRP